MARKIARRLVESLRSSGASFVAVESCTGGLVADRITRVAGASEVFWGSLVTYQESAKRELLGVSARLLQDEGAVSRAVALAMARAGLKKLGRGRGISVSTTGVAGPGGGTARTPVGLCFIGVASRGHARVVRVAPSTRRLSRSAQKSRFAERALEEALREARRL